MLIPDTFLLLSWLVTFGILSPTQVCGQLSQKWGSLYDILPARSVGGHRHLSGLSSWLAAPGTIVAGPLLTQDTFLLGFSASGEHSQVPLGWLTVQWLCSWAFPGVIASFCLLSGSRQWMGTLSSCTLIGGYDLRTSLHCLQHSGNGGKWSRAGSRLLALGCQPSSLTSWGILRNQVFPQHFQEPVSSWPPRIGTSCP